MFTVEELGEAEHYLRDLRREIGALPPHLRSWTHEAESALLRSEQEARRARHYRARRLLDVLGIEEGAGRDV